MGCEIRLIIWCKSLPYIRPSGQSCRFGDIGAIVQETGHIRIIIAECRQEVATMHQRIVLGKEVVIRHPSWDLSVVSVKSWRVMRRG